MDKNNNSAVLKKVVSKYSKSNRTGGFTVRASNCNRLASYFGRAKLLVYPETRPYILFNIQLQLLLLELRSSIFHTKAP